MSAENFFGWALGSICFFGWALATTYTNHAPLIPIFMERWGFTPTEAGLLSFAFFFAMAAVSLPAGVLSDRLGPKRIGSVGLAIACVSTVGMGYAHGFSTLLGLKVLGGVGAGMAFIAGVRYVPVVFAPSRAYLVQGFYGGCVQLGAGASLYLMPLLYARLHLQGAFLTSAALVLVALLFWMGIAPDRRAVLPPARLSLAMRSGTVWLLTMAHTGTFGLAILVGTWITTFLSRDLGLSLTVAGGLGSAVLVAGILSRPLGGILIDRRWISARTMIRMSLLAGTVGLGLLALPGRPVWAALVALLLLGIMLNLPYAAVMNTANAAVPASPGAAIGIVGGGSLILIATGAPIMGVLYASTKSFLFAFGLLGAFSFLAFWLTRLIQGEEESVALGT